MSNESASGEMNLDGEKEAEVDPKSGPHKCSTMEEDNRSNKCAWVIVAPTRLPWVVAGTVSHSSHKAQ